MNEYSVCWRGAPTLFLLESHTILTQVLIYCFCAIYSRVTSVGAIFYSFSQLCSGSELMNGLRGKNYKTRNHLRSIELMFSFATILLRKSSNLAQALTTMMSTKNSKLSTDRIWNLSLDWKIFSPGGDLHSLIVSMALSVTSYLCLSFVVRLMAYYSYYIDFSMVFWSLRTFYRFPCYIFMA